jgi:hypothetical protein
VVERRWRLRTEVVAVADQATARRRKPAKLHVAHAAWRVLYAARMKNHLPVVAFLLFASGCANAPADIAQQGEAVSGCKQNQYPCGPFGTTVGSTIDDLQLDGKDDSNGNGIIDVADTERPFVLSDYFNPHDHKKEAKALAIVICAQWCVPCQLEASTELNPLVQGYQAADAPVVLLGAVVQNQSGAPATIANLNAWANRFKPNYPLVIDPNAALSAYTEAFPTYVVVRTRDMQITDVHQGSDVTELKASIDAILAD